MSIALLDYFEDFFNAFELAVFIRHFSDSYIPHVYNDGDNKYKLSHLLPPMSHFLITFSKTKTKTKTKTLKNIQKH